MTDLQRLLGDAERPRELSAIERQRLEERLGIDGGVLPLAPAGPQHRGRPRRLVGLVAAAVVAAVAVASLVVLRQDSESLSTADQAPGRSVEQVCGLEIDLLVRYLGEWGGLANWLQTNGAEPDVAGALVGAWEAVGQIDVHRGVATTVLEELVPAVEGVGADGTVAARLDRLDERRVAMLAALDELETVLDGWPGCPADGLRSVR